jgi:hypothetical protein
MKMSALLMLYQFQISERIFHVKFPEFQRGLPLSSLSEGEDASFC